MKKASTIATEAIPAATRNAVCSPASSRRLRGDIPAASRVALRAARMATRSAVPAAPATCWKVVRIALPWEYNDGGSGFKPVVKDGVNKKASPAENSRCRPNSMITGVSISARLNPSVAQHQGRRPGHGEHPRSEPVEQPADDRAEQPHQQPAGQQEQARLEGAQSANILQIERAAG